MYTSRVLPCGREMVLNFQLNHSALPPPPHFVMYFFTNTSTVEKVNYHSQKLRQLGRKNKLFRGKLFASGLGYGFNALPFSTT